jgi:hypothetical protein
MALSGTTVSFGYRLVRLRRMLLTGLSISTNAVLFAVISLVLGIGSAFWMVDRGTALTTQRNGPWLMWTRAGQRDLDPYTRARQAKAGNLPLSTQIAATWEARYDIEGRRLHSSCEYLLESEPIDATWFSLAVYDDNGLLIPNSADRHSFTSQTIAANPDGSFFIVLAREARPGNWLPVGGAGRISLLLTMIEPKPSVTESAQQLPSIRRIGCR